MMDEKEVIEALTKHDEQLKSMDKRLEACEETTGAINSLTQSIVKMDVTLNNTNEAVKDLRVDVNSLKDEPKKKWDKISAIVATAFISGVIGFLLNYIL